eukprot:g3169.t1
MSEQDDVAQLLGEPSPDQAGPDLLDRLYTDLQITGNAYLEAITVSDETRPRGLFPLRVDSVRVRENSRGQRIGFTVSLKQGERKISLAADGWSPVLHLKLYHPANSQYGLSPMAAARKSLDIHNGAAGWWSALHYPRPGGARAPSPTGWQPELKPVRLIEIGFPAVDKGANAPNVFVDPKSSESALPFYSNGTRDDLIQRRALTTALSYWQAQPCVEQALVWAWDGRPWPDFPAREDVWKDGANWQFGHWLNGRTGLMELADTVQDIAQDAHIEVIADDLDGVVDGYLIDGVSTPASALTPLSLAFDYRIRETESGLVAVQNKERSGIELSDAWILEDGRRDRMSLMNAAPTGMLLTYISGDFSYQPATAHYRSLNAARQDAIHAALPLVLTDARAESLCQALFEQARTTRSCEVQSALAGSAKLEVADRVRFDGVNWRVEQLEDELLVRRVMMVAHETSVSLDRSIAIPDAGRPPVYAAGLEVRVISIPGLSSGDSPIIAVSADPWGGAVPVRIGATLESLQQVATVTRSALMGQLLTDLPPGAAGA